MAKKKAVKKRAPRRLSRQELEVSIICAEDIEEKIQKQRQELEGIRADIRHTMEKTGLKLAFALQERLQAQLIEQTVYAWQVEELKRRLTPYEFAKHCPPKPDSEELRKLLEGRGPLAAALQKCCKPGKRTNLVIERVRTETLQKNIVAQAEAARV